MPLKRLTLSPETSKKPIDPLQIFGRLTLRGSIENIWDPQAEALRAWHQRRNESDVAIEINTGGGKTLVGLLAAQSLVNETNGKVLYVCANNQLVEQTYDRARAVGLSPATRYRQRWHDRSEFDAATTFCLTNYAGVFHGRSIFHTADISAIIFDDAHVAENIIRGQFILRIPPHHDAFSRILAVCRPHFSNTSKASTFEDIASGRSRLPVLFVPMFVVWKHANEFRSILLDCQVDQERATMFVWEYLKNHLNQCCVLVSAGGLEITPVLPPLSQLSYFQEPTRRVYLTATLPSRASFLRTFGVLTPNPIRPRGKSGDAQRLFVFVPGQDHDTQVENAKFLAKDQKSAVISPSSATAAAWVPPATLYETTSGHAEIERFAKSTGVEMLGLVARYDGIDLPGDSCRLLILDRLPTADNLLDRFIDESIRIETIRTSHTATRVVQAIGRIFRSNTDHGVVLLVGPQLHSWVSTPKKRSYFPTLLQKQLALALALTKKVLQRETTWMELIEGVLTGDENWDAMYNEYIDRFETHESSEAPDWHTDLILAERQATAHLWDGQFARGADVYHSLADAGAKYDRRLAAWYRHWRGLALLCADDRQAAVHEFTAAGNVRSELGRPSAKRDTLFRPSETVAVERQAVEVANLYRKRRVWIANMLPRIERELVYGPDTAKAEEAMKNLGTLLGLCAERPDKSSGTGPDVIWQLQRASRAWGFELKTDKKAGGEYSKRDVSQCHDHAEWLARTYGDNCNLTIIGRMLPVSGKANPAVTLRVTDIPEFQDLFARVKLMHEAVAIGDQTVLEHTVESWLRHYGLKWPGCVESLDDRLAVDLQRQGDGP